MDASDMPPQPTKRGTKNRHIPVEILQEILLNLPVKSLLRFSSVSKSWNSTIFGSGFIKNYGGRERVFLNHSFSHHLNDLSSFPLSAILSDNSTEDAAVLVYPFEHPTRMKAFCDGLWCVEDTITNSLFLWNPSMRTYRKLPNPTNPTRQCQYAYGLGYDSVGEDYKIMKVGLVEMYKPGVVELYSLRSDSWRDIQPFPKEVRLCFSSGVCVGGDFQKMGVFVAGALHWMVVPHNPPSRNLGEGVIISFDLSTEKYGEVGLPEFDQVTKCLDCIVEMTVLKGMLCLCVNYISKRFVLWVMEDYGVVESWTKKLGIDFKSISRVQRNPMLRPFYFYDNGQFLINVSAGEDFVADLLGLFMGGEKEKKSIKILLYKDEQTLLEKDFRGGRCSSISDSFVYVESLVSPAMWPELVNIKPEVA